MVWVDVPFSEEEMACKCGCGQSIYRPAFMHRLVAARYIANFPFQISSWTRCPQHNRDVGGEEDSEHLDGWAADILTPTSRARWVVIRALILAGFERIGIGPDYVHAGAGPTKPRFVIWGYYKE